MESSKNHVEYVLANQVKACINGKSGIRINFANQIDRKFYWVMIERVGENLIFTSNDADWETGYPPSLHESVALDDFGQAVTKTATAVLEHIGFNFGADVLVLSDNSPTLITSTTDDSPILEEKTEVIGL